MRRRRTTLVLVAAVCALQLVAVGLYFRNRAVGDDLDAADAAAAEQEHRRFIEGGVPGHRKRIDDFIAQVAAYPDFDALAAGLNDHVLNGDDIVYAVGRQSKDPKPSLQFAKTLADRRVARLYVLLKAMNPGAASQRAAALFDEKLRIHEEAIAKGIAKWRDHAGVGGPIPVRRNFHALSGAFFLCAAFCDPRTVLEKLDRWDETIGRHIDDVAPDPSLKLLLTELARNRLPERLYLLNVYVFLLERRGGLTAEDVMRKADVKFDGPELFQERAPFTAWDAHTNYFDFTHFHRGVPVDSANALIEVSFARSWRYLQMDEAKQNELLARVREMIEHLNGDR